MNRSQNFPGVDRKSTRLNSSHTVNSYAVFCLIKKIKDLAQELGIDKSVHFLGHRDDIPQLLSLSDLLVLPSYTEGLPLVILEAMAAGLPVVATPVGGIPEVVIHQETGFLVAVEDVQALGDVIFKLLQNPLLKNEIGNKGLEMVRKDFSLEKMCEEVFDIYQKVKYFVAQRNAPADCK